MRSGVLIAILLTCSYLARAVERHAASGLVLKVDPVHKTVLLSCAKVEGYMDPGVTRFSVRETKSLAGLVPGQMVDFTLSRGAEFSYAEDIHIRDFQNLEQQSLAARRLKIVEDLAAGSSRPKEMRIGEPVPNAVLIDQNHRKVNLAGFPGKVVVVNFFYTHCPLPDYCFRLSNNMGNVQRRFKVRMGRSLVLLSVSFDPVHDQPDVLANYARTWHADPNWHFLTGESSTVKNICTMFGVNSWPDEAELMHSLHTVVIDRKGRLAANLEGNQFTAQQLGDLVQVVLK